MRFKTHFNKQTMTLADIIRYTERLEGFVQNVIGCADDLDDDVLKDVIRMHLKEMNIQSCDAELIEE